MSPTIWQDGKWLRAGLIAAVALTLTLGATTGPAFAEDDDDKWDTIDNKILRGILSGLGLKRDGEGGIDYHERSPLVVPPSRELPPPQNAATVTNDPAWPKDPDIARKKTARKKQKNTVESEEADMRQLSPSELRGTAGTAGRTGTLSDGNAGPTGARPEQLSPSQLGHRGLSFGSVFNREGTAVQFTGEPQRSTLTEPPPGLRTPSANHPYGSKGVLERVDNTKTEDRGSYGTNR
jgi:hypothetical protein